MRLVTYLSEAVIPLIILIIVGTAMSHHQRVYEDFLDGAKSGIRTVVEIMPTLIGLMVAVGILRASGFLDFLSGILEKILFGTHFPTELVPLAIVKMFSSSAWNRLHDRKSCFHYACKHRDHILYHVGVFYVRQGEENPLYTGGSNGGNPCRNRYKCRTCTNLLKFKSKKIKYWGKSTKNS